jgi:hypothetical protein
MAGGLAIVVAVMRGVRFGVARFGSGVDDQDSEPHNVGKRGESVEPPAGLSMWTSLLLILCTEWTDLSSRAKFKKTQGSIVIAQFLQYKVDRTTRIHDHWHDGIERTVEDVVEKLEGELLGW